MISGNGATNSGGGVVTVNKAPLVLTWVVVSDNRAGSASGNGGGIDTEGGAPISLAGCTIEGNTAGQYGVGIEAAGGTSVSIGGSIVQDNFAENTGGGYADQGNASLSVVNSFFLNNTAGTGGGLAASGSTISIVGTTIGGNDALAGSGGGLDFEGSTEYLTGEVESLYQRYLHCGADPGGLNSHIAFFQAGGTIEQAAKGLIGAPEFAAEYSGVGDIELQATYQSALDRVAGASELAAWDALLSDRTTLATIGQYFVTSTEYDADFVAGDFLAFLGRSASLDDVSGYTAALQSGLKPPAFLADVLGSPESFNDRS